MLWLWWFLVFDLLVAPLIRSGEYLVSKKDTLIEYPLQAEIVRNLRSAAGREDFIRVRLFLREGRLCAEPVLGIYYLRLKYPSSSLSSAHVGSLGACQLLSAVKRTAPACIYWTRRLALIILHV